VETRLISPNRRLGILISGRGSNLQAILDAIQTGSLDATVAVVVSNQPEAKGLSRAIAAGVEAVHLSARAYANRDEYDFAIASLLQARAIGLVCLAGFMRLVRQPLLDAFPNRILNIHPSLLPAFPGLDAQRQALDHGAKVTGATVHLVDAGLDAGPIIAQSAVPIRDDDTVDTLSARILIEEHRLYPQTIGQFLDGSCQLQGRRVTCDVVRPGSASGVRLPADS